MESMDMKMQDLQDLYAEQLRDLYSAETQLLAALPLMAQAANSTSLQQAFESHLAETKVQQQTVRDLILSLGQDPEGHECKAMRGLIQEGQEMIKEDATPAVKDAGLIAAAQRVEHYEIAGYGTVRTYAELLGMDEHVQQLQRVLDQEYAADEKLTGLSKRINVQAAQQ